MRFYSAADVIGEATRLSAPEFANRHPNPAVVIEPYSSSGSIPSGDDKTRRLSIQDIAALRAQRPGHIVGGATVGWFDSTSVSEIRIGRQPGYELVIPHARVSKLHAAVRREGDGWVVIDSSTNGTAVDGSPLGRGTARPLAEAERIVLADSVAVRFFFSPLRLHERLVASAAVHGSDASASLMRLEHLAASLDSFGVRDRVSRVEVLLSGPDGTPRYVRLRSDASGITVEWGAEDLYPRRRVLSSSAPQAQEALRHILAEAVFDATTLATALLTAPELPASPEPPRSRIDWDGIERPDDPTGEWQLGQTFT